MMKSTNRNSKPLTCTKAVPRAGKAGYASQLIGRAVALRWRFSPITKQGSKKQIKNPCASSSKWRQLSPGCYFFILWEEKKDKHLFFLDLVGKWGAIKYEILFWNFVWPETANQVFLVQQYFLPVNVLAVTQVTFFFLISRIQVLLCCINCNVFEFPESLNVLNIKVIVL